MPASSSAENRSEDGSAVMSEFGDHIDVSAFEQILEMDDDEEDREFSRGIVYDFFTQAEEKFEEMESSLETRDLLQLSHLGHFLKGSSATLGLAKVRDYCEKIQHYGAMKSEDGSRDEPDEDKCLALCKDTIKKARAEFLLAEALLRRFYRDDSGK